MAFGVLETRGDGLPQGTTILEVSATGSGKAPGDKVELVLSPSPSTSPRDPLNWSPLRKELLFITIIFGACVTGVIGPVLVPGFPIIAKAFDITLTQVTLLNGSLVMALGVSSYLSSCLATIVGKRPIYFFTAIMLFATSCWGAAAKSYNILLAARVFQGLSMGGFFNLAGTASINDIYFVHQRGFRIGLWNFAVIVSVNVTPIISSRIIVNLGWPWAFWILAITSGVLLVMIFFFMPETTFQRQPTEDLVIASDVDTRLSFSGTSRRGSRASFSRTSVHDSTGTAEGLKRLPDVEKLDNSMEAGSISKVEQYSTLRSLFNFERPKGSAPPSHLLTSLVSPIRLLLHPAALWACAMWSVTFTWVIVQGAVASQIFSAPPYNLSPTAVGNLIGIAPLVGSALGTTLGGYLCDFIAVRLAFLNKGVYEPEYRLITILIPCLFPLVIGSFGLGAAIANGLSAIVCGVFLAILNFAVGVGCTGIVAYSNDTFGDRAGEVFGLAMLVKSAFAFGLTFMLNDYYANHGPRVFFFTWGGLSVAVTVLGTVPIYVFGKRIRAWADRLNLF